MTDCIIILCTCPDDDSAKSLSHGLISESLAACVNIVPAIVSVYQWQGKICEDQEQLLIIKTEKPLFDKVATYIKSSHPYELPEVIAVTIEHGANEYLDWITRSVSPASARSRNE